MDDKEFTDITLRFFQIEYEALKAESEFREKARLFYEELTKEREHRPRIFSSKNI